MKSIPWTLFALLSTCLSAPAGELLPIPNRIVVLTFDDSVKSHFTVVRPILKQHGFGATFFITEGFDQQNNENKVFQSPYAACSNADGTRWVISAWKPCVRCWGNEACPCLHSDPQFADCEPGQTQRLVGWFSFYEGREIAAELQRIEATHWFDGE
jgi:peptidoglycan/xylan/chitin deacetylase (PgdA/CDA1 family)